MFFAHLPAGYLLTRYLQQKTGQHSRRLMAVGLIASIFPDIDLLYFYFIDNRQTMHHRYVTHLPLAWVALGALSVTGLWISGKMIGMVYIGVALSNLLLHMVLDSVAGTIYWLYPFSTQGANLLIVPAGHEWWVWNFVLHWTFLLELLIIAAAFISWKRACRKIY